MTVLGCGSGPWDEVDRWLVLAPHPDDFEVVAVTMKFFRDRGSEIQVDVLTGGASGVEDGFAEGWEARTTAREAEQRESCRRFGLPEQNLRFHRFPEDESGHMQAGKANEARVHGILDRVQPDGVILPHGDDSNADHRRTYRYFSSWAKAWDGTALLVKDPKSLSIRIDLVMPFGEQDAEWKGELLRCHQSQHQRNLRTRGIGFDERILAMNREEGRNVGARYAEVFEVWKNRSA